MTAQANRANQTVQIRADIQAEIKKIKKAATTLSNAVYRAAMTARELDATEAENRALIAVIPKQRRADFKRVVSAPAEHVDDSMPTNLVKGARYLSLRAEGFSAEDAKAITEGKKKKPKGADQQRNDDDAGESGNDDAGESGNDESPQPSGEVGAAAQSGKVQSPLAMIRDGIDQLESQYAGDKTIAAACRALRSGLDKAAAQIAKVEAHEDKAA